MKIYRSILAMLAACGAVMYPHRAGAVTFGHGATSEIMQESNGVWLFLDGVKTPAFTGIVYQNTEGNTHVRAYEYGRSMSSLYTGLDDKDLGGQGHGARLEKMGIDAIRVYELPAGGEDAEHIKAIFRRLYDKHHIKVLIGDWAGLHTGMDFNSPHDLSQLRMHLQKLVDTYSGEAWVLGWQLGNENNYHINSGILGKEIQLDAANYYVFMDGLAGMMKEQLGRRQRRQFVSLGQGDLTDAEAPLIGAMTNIDAVGVNCYRKAAEDFEGLISLLGAKTHKPVYFSEIGRPADAPDAQEQQYLYLQDVSSRLLSHGAGGLRSGSVIGLFLHEATDEEWKRYERGREEDAHYGILGKSTEAKIGRYFNQYHEFSQWVLPTNNAPDTLIESAWQCVEGPYARKYYRLYGYAWAYAGRAITLYQEEARRQQQQLSQSKLPGDRAASPDYWALNTVGTAYFIMVDSWMLLSYDYKGAERPANDWQWILQKSDFDQSRWMPPAVGDGSPTNAVGCIFSARQVYASLHQLYPDANLRQADGEYIRLDRVMKTRYPELSQPYIPLSCANLLGFVGGGLVLILGLAMLARWRASKKSVASVSAMGAGTRFLFFTALLFNLTSLFWLMNWWFHPVRINYYTVSPVLYVVLTSIGALGVVFYFYIWHVLWNMRRPIHMPPAQGLRAAIATTRVASEPIDALEPTLAKMANVAYPHDSYLLDEEDNPEAKACCEKQGVIHFSRKGIARYNQPSGIFQARTKGGNLNSWLYEHGQKYEFVTFLDPDHAPRPEFLDRVLGYFANSNVAFVQAPQVFYNRAENWIARGAAEQSYFMYGPMEMGLFGIGACVVNGSHSTFRIQDLLSLKGEAYAVHDADDILTSMRIHARKKSGVYVPEVLAEGLAPDNWEEFSKQQRRWCYSMFHLFFHYFLREQRGMPWRCKLVYLLFTAFYFREVAFIGLLILPFVSAITGNPPINANLTAFCFRCLPFFMLHAGILILLGQRFLIPGGSKRGFWYRAGLLWVAMWWDHLCAMFKALVTRRVSDRVVSAKWKSGAASPWAAVRPHVILAISAAAVFAWTCLRSDRRETVWGTLIFLGLISLSQAFIIYKVISVSAKPSTQPAWNINPLTIATSYKGQIPKP